MLVLAKTAVLKALEKWHPGYLDCGNRLIPQNFKIPWYLRTAVSVDPKGGQSLIMSKCLTTAGCFVGTTSRGPFDPMGEQGQPAWQEVPGEYRNMLKRLIVIQGDTEPDQLNSNALGLTAPSLYDMRNLFQVNVEEGRHRGDGLFATKVFRQGWPRRSR